MMQQKYLQKYLQEVRLAVLGLLLVSSLTLASCAQNTEPSSPPPNAAVEVPSVPPPMASSSPEASLETSPETATGTAETNAELPASVAEAIVQDIATRQNVPVESLKVVDAIAKSWPDGCLGLGGPDDICTFALVDGWEVTVSGDNKQWVYRSDSEGLTIKPEEQS